MPESSVRIFPIPRSTFDQEYEFFRYYSWHELIELENFIDRPLGRAVEDEIPYHMDLEVRPGIEDETERHQDAYRAGVFIGTVLLRHRIRLLRGEGEDVTLPTEDTSTIDWATMRASRFLLTPLIEGDGEFDPKPIFRTLVSAWDIQESLGQLGMVGTEKDESAALPSYNWVVIGMGDLLAMYASRYEYGRALLETVPLGMETQNGATLTS